MKEVEDVGIEGHTVTVKVATPMFVIVASIILLSMYAFLVFLMYVWFSDIATHLVYIEGMLSDIHQTIPTPDPTDYI